MRVLYFGTYERNYPRNAQVISALRTAGVEVVEHHEPVYEARRDNWAVRWTVALRLFVAEMRLRYSSHDAFDVVLVGYPGHFDVPHARRVAGKRPLVFNPLISLHDTLVGDRSRYREGRFTARILWVIDRRALRTPDLVVADTEANAEFLAEVGDLPRERVQVCLVGAEDRLFHAGWRPDEPFRVLFVGKLIPLHGLPTILEAARLAPELQVRIVGSGQLNELMTDLPPNVEWLHWIEYDEPAARVLGRRLRARDLRHLGQGVARDPEQGVPGARLRNAADHGRHARGARAPDRRGERAPRSSGRSSRAGRGDAPHRSGSRAREEAEQWRPRRLRSAGERGGAGRAVADAPRSARLLRPRPLLWTAIGAYTAGFGALSILRYRAYNTGRFDLGNMVQAVWSTAHGHPLAVTDLQGNQASRLGSHVDPILAAFAPLWWIWPSPNMLVVVQTLAIALGALPVFWLARKHLGSERVALGFALAYLLYPAVQWLTLNEFHPVALACPLLLFAFWYLDEDRLVAFGIFAVLAALTKEEIPLVIAGMGLWYAVSRRRWVEGGAIAVAGVLVTAISVEVVLPHFNEGASSSFYQRYGSLGSSPGEILKTLLLHPGRVLETAFDHEGAHYLLDLFLPLLLLGLAAPLVLLAAVPELGLNLLSATHTQSSIHHHYTAGLIPPLFVAMILGAARG